MASSRTVLVTGCSSGIGRATAERLAGRGWTVYATARRPESVKDLGDAGCRLLALDVCDEGSMEAAVRAAEGETGPLDALVNNAGYGEYGAVEEVPLEAWRRQLETNVLGVVRMAQLVLPGMRERGSGRIVNISSMGGRLVFPGGGAYHASKFALEALSDALRFEVRPFGIKVVVVEPGLIKTGFGDTVAGTLGENRRSGGPYHGLNQTLDTVSRNAYEGPMARLAVGPENVAKAVDKALSRRRPRPRYIVTAGARMVLGTKTVLSDRGFDGFLRAQFKVPKAKASSG
ncbi:MAG: SDR family NAD(P)-dependent oxidoreductase [Actinobacteria bacterium]|nr:SDR family NAD(P)-dependent oxidoreductase [Actinomycetota bacterium]